MRRSTRARSCGGALSLQGFFDFLKSLGAARLTAMAAVTLALSRHGNGLNRLTQPQRAGQLTWNGQVYRAETRYLEGLPWSSGGVLGYVFSRDGIDIGGVALNGMAPSFYLPPEPGADRDIVALLGAILFTFQDPGRPPL